MLRLFRQHAEHICLTNRFCFRVLIGGFQRIAQRIHQRGAVRPQPVERPGHDQFFQHPPVELFGIGARAKIKQLTEIAAVVTRLNDRLDRAFTHAFDRADTVDNLAVVIDVEVVQPGVDIRRQDLQPHAPAFIHQPHHFLSVVHIGSHYRRHKLSRIVRFQPQRLVRDQRVGSGVRFVKPVPGEFLHQVEDFHRQFAVNTVFLRAVFKDGALFGHLFRLFLTHRTTQHIRTAKSIARKHLGNLHDLFLIQDDAVGWFQYWFQAFVLPLHIRIGDLFTTMLTIDEVIYHAGLQRPRTEQGHQGYHIFEAVRLQTLNQVFHAAGFKLEDRRGFRALQHIEAFLIVQRDSGNIQRRLTVLFTAGVNHLQRPVNDSEGTQAKEVELHEAGIFHVVFIKLGNRVQPLFITVQWRKIGDFRRGDNHTTGVFTGVSGHAFQLTRHVDQRFNLFICLVDFWQLRFSLEGFRQRHPRIGGHQF